MAQRTPNGVKTKCICLLSFIIPSYANEVKLCNSIGQKQTKRIEQFALNLSSHWASSSGTVNPMD